MLTNETLEETLAKYLQKTGVEGVVVQDGAEESILLYPDEMTVNKLRLLVDVADDVPVRNVLIGADDAFGREYLAVDFSVENKPLGRAVIVDNTMVEYKKTGEPWRKVGD